MARRENLTIRQLGASVAGARGKNAIHRQRRRQVADYMEEWFVKGACDGFCVMPPYIPGAHDDFCNLVIPELQRRGLFRTEYEGPTLRDNLGLPRPESRVSVASCGSALQRLELRRGAGAQEAEVAADREEADAALGAGHRALGVGAIEARDLAGLVRRPR